MSGEVALGARLVLGGVLVAAGTAKSTTAGRRVFAAGLRAFGIRQAASRPLARLIPAFELVLGALLVAGVAPRAAAIGAMALLAVFSAAIVRVIVRGDEVDCGCFGRTATRVGPGSLLRNTVLILLGALAAAEPAWSAPWGPWRRTLPVILVAVAALLLAALASQARHHLRPPSGVVRPAP